MCSLHIHLDNQQYAGGTDDVTPYLVKECFFYQFYVLKYKPNLFPVKFVFF